MVFRRSVSFGLGLGVLAMALLLAHPTVAQLPGGAAIPDSCTGPTANMQQCVADIEAILRGDNDQTPPPATKAAPATTKAAPATTKAAPVATTKAAPVATEPATQAATEPVVVEDKPPAEAPRAPSGSISPPSMDARVATGDMGYGSCSGHPAYTEGMKGVIVRSWKHSQNPRDKFLFWPSAYLPRQTSHVYAPVDDPSSTKYAGMDMFWTFFHTGYDGNSVSMKFNRGAKVHLVLATSLPEINVGERVGLPGWESEGWVKLTEGDTMVSYGVRSKNREFEIPSEGYMFSKVVDDSITLPTMDWIRANRIGIPYSNIFSILISEADGTASEEPPTPPGVPRIIPGERCPDQLHNMWVTDGDDPNDPDIAGRKWATWHPMMDPCYWCGYNHEHGSNSAQYTGMRPMYDYNAWKNDREDESHEGFKSICIDYKGYYVVYDIHAKLSDTRRFFTRFHSGVFSIFEKDSGRLMVRLATKLDYGLIRVQLKNLDMMTLPISRPDEEQILREGRETDKDRSMIVNVLSSQDRGSLDPSYLYRPGDEFIHGQYERWNTMFMCTKVDREPTCKVDFRIPGTALRSATAVQSTPPIKLGKFENGAFVPAKSSERRMFLGGFSIGDSYCDDRGSAVSGGVWYTDPKGLEVFSEPGPNRMRQYIRPGFNLRFDMDIYDIIDQWGGLYRPGGGDWNDFMDTLDPDSN